MSGGDPSPVPPWLLEVDYPPGLLSMSEGGTMEGTVHTGNGSRIQGDAECGRPASEPLVPLPGAMYPPPAAAPQLAAAPQHLSTYPPDLHMGSAASSMMLPSAFHALPGPFSSTHGAGPEFSSHVTHYRVAPQPAPSAFAPSSHQHRAPSPSPHFSYLPAAQALPPSSYAQPQRTAYSRHPGATMAPASHYPMAPQQQQQQQQQAMGRQQLSHDPDFLTFLGLGSGPMPQHATGLPEGHMSYHPQAYPQHYQPQHYAPDPSPARAAQSSHASLNPHQHMHQGGGEGGGLGAALAYGLFAPAPPRASEGVYGEAYGEVRPSITSEEGELEEDDEEAVDMSSSEDDTSIHHPPRHTQMFGGGDSGEAALTGGAAQGRGPQTQRERPQSSPRSPRSPASNASSSSSKPRSTRRGRTHRPHAKKRSRKSELESLQAAVAASGGDPSELSLDSLLKPKPRADGQKRGRGRPRTKAAIEVFIYDENGEPIRRRRGRPPKSQAVAFITSDGEKIPIPRKSSCTDDETGHNSGIEEEDEEEEDEEVMERRDSVDSTYSTMSQEEEGEEDSKPRARSVAVPRAPPLLAHHGTSSLMSAPLLLASGSSSSGMMDDGSGPSTLSPVLPPSQEPQGAEAKRQASQPASNKTAGTD